jgi:hypothetical protein
MSRFSVGDIIVFQIPLSDGSSTKNRRHPFSKALPYFGGVVTLSAIATSSQDVGDAFAVELLPTDLEAAC